MMTDLPSKAYDKVKRDGIISLCSSIPPYLLKTFLGNIRIKYRSDVANPKKRLYVNPKDIEYYRPSLFSGSYQDHYGMVKDGDWDKERYAIKEHPKYQACKGRAEEGKSWDETGIIDHMTKKLEESGGNEIEHGCSSREDIEQIYNQERENLYQNIKINGFDEDISNVCCRIHIGRNGEMILASGGRHRLFFSKVLEINKIPVRVLWRHQQWQSLRKEVKDSKNYNELSGEAKKAIDHPDLCEFVPNDWRTT